MLENWEQLNSQCRRSAGSFPPNCQIVVAEPRGRATHLAKPGYRDTPVNPLGIAVAQDLKFDLDRREELLRDMVTDRLSIKPPPILGDAVVASYFLVLRTQRLGDFVKEIAYHSSSGVRNPPAGTLLADCTAWGVGVDAFDSTERIGLLHIAYPLRMLLDAAGRLSSYDILHTVAGAIIFDAYESQDARLIRLTLPDAVIACFPGPAHGPEGIRGLTSWPAGEPAFGTILKPTAGITSDDVGRLVAEVAGSQLLLFIKEDENLYPGLGYAPVGERTARAIEAMRQTHDRRGGRGLIFAPHVGSAPSDLLAHVKAAIDAGASGLMFSETFAGGAVRMVRETTRGLKVPPAIYGHNAGIGTRTRAIWREVIDVLARLDGIDFRQTAPIRPGRPLLRPYAAEWSASEQALLSPMSGIRQTMVVRAGALDQGNIVLNLQDVAARGIGTKVLFLAGSAINSIKNARGEPAPSVGLEAMGQALELHRAGALNGARPDEHLPALMDLAQRMGLNELGESLRQRYPDVTR